MASSMKYSSGSDEDNQQHQAQTVDIRKRKRMISNRESARRSRQRKQQHLNNLTAQINQLKTQNQQILGSSTTTTQLYLNIEAENSILRAQIDELSNRLQSLNDIVRCLTTYESDDQKGFGGFDVEIIDEGFSTNPWGFPFGGNNNCCVMPAIDAFMC